MTTGCCNREKKTFDIRLWHRNLQSVSTPHITTIQSVKKYDALKWIWFPFVCPDDFYISQTTRWLFLGFTRPYKSLKKSCRRLCSGTYIGSVGGLACVQPHSTTMFIISILVKQLQHVRQTAEYGLNHFQFQSRTSADIKCRRRS